MKRIRRSPTSKRVFQRKVYLDELENLISIVEEHGCTVRLTDNQYEYNNISELVSENPNGMRYLELIAEMPDKPITARYVTVTFYRQTITIEESFITSTSTLALATSLAASTGRKFGWLTFLIFSIGTLLFNFLAVFLLLSLVSDATAEIVWKPIFWALFFMSSVIFAIASIDVLFGKMIITRHRRKEQSFIERNHDKIIIAIVTGFITLVLSELVPRIIEALTN